MKTIKEVGIALFLGSSALLTAQDRRPEIKLSSTIEAKDVFVVPAGNAISVLPGRSGEFYLHLIAGPDPTAGRLYLVNFKGERSIVLDVKALVAKGSIPTHDYYVTNYSADPRGGIVAVLDWGDKPMIVSRSAILSVDEHGEVRSFLSLEDDVMPYQALVFSSRAYLLALMNYPGEPTSRLHLQVRDFHGKILVPEIPLYSEASPDKAKKPKPANSEREPKGAAANAEDQELFGNNAPGLSLSLVLVSSIDNYIYAYSTRKQDVIERISDTGKFQPIPLVKPQVPPAQLIKPIDMLAMHNQILLHFAAFRSQADPSIGNVPTKHYWSVYNTTTGDLIDTYVSQSDEYGARSILAGYDIPNFYFLDPTVRPSGELAYSILRATP